MPVRSSICTYSPTASSNKYSSAASPSSLSVGHYKPLSSLSANSTSSSSSNSIGGSSTLGRPLSSRYSSSYSPLTYSTLPSSSSAASSAFSSNKKSPSIISSSTSSSHYRPLSSSSFGRSPLTSGAGHTGYTSRYSSTGASSSSSSSLSSAGSSLLASSDPHHSSSSASSSATTSGYLSSSIGNYHTYHPSPSSASSRRRFSRTSFDGSSSTDGSSPLSPQYLHLHTPNSSNYSSRNSHHHHHSPSSASSSLPSEVPKGLVNLGNTCYMNSAIQSLYSIESFRQLILSSASYDKPLLSELCNLFKSMQGSRVPPSPRNFHNAFSRRHQSKFTEYHQQDAQEFLRYLINSVHEECNKAASSIGGGSSNSRRTTRHRSTPPPSAPKSAQEAWAQYRDIVDDSPFVDLLVGQMCSTIVCSSCQNKSLCWDPFWDLSLPLQRGRHYGPTRLSDLIDDFCAKETLDADERPICGQCKKATRSTKQIKLSRLPKLLILHLKKFSNDGYKLTSPEVQIDKTLIFNQETTYTLSACISHHGHSSSSGHYTSHCKYSTSWFHFNDDRVRDVGGSFESIKLEDAYVLFYTQQQSQQPTAMMTASNNHQSKL